MPTSPKTQHHKERRAFQLQAARLAVKVRSERAVRGWTIEDAAERFGVEPAHVRRIEKGTTNPTLSVLVSMARAFSVPTASILHAGTCPTLPLRLGRREADWLRQAVVARLAAVLAPPQVRDVVAAITQSKDEDEFWLLVRDHGQDVLHALADIARERKQASVAKGSLDAAMALALAVLTCSEAQQ